MTIAWSNDPTELEKQFGLWIDHAGYARIGMNGRISSESSRLFVLHLIVEGNACFIRNNRTQPLGQGDLLCQFPDGASDGRIRTAGGPLRTLYVALGGDNARRLLARAGMQACTPFRLNADGLAFLPAFQNMLNLNLRRTAHKDMQLIEAVARFFDKLSSQQASPPDADSWVHKGKAYMDAHFTEGITVDHVAAFLNVHRSYLTRKFTEVYRVPPKPYLHRLRMEHAAELLRRTTMSVADVADTLHYSDAFSFSRAYKNYHRQAPSLARCSSTK